MTDQTRLVSTIEQTPFADTYISSLNPRTVVSEDGIAALAENIRALGLIQNLAGVCDADARIAIVAGGRRHRALALLQDDPRFSTIPVRIAPDAATAATWASSENHHREQPHPADEVREYGAMAARGVAVPAIAMAFGATEKHVYRRLALASLPAPVLDALRAGEISLSMAAAFTIGDDAARILAVLAEVRGRGVSETAIKRLLKPDSVSGSDRRAIFVGTDAYAAAGGKLGGDLFTEETLFDSPDVLDATFAAALDAKAREIVETEGWLWCEAQGGSYLPYELTEGRRLARVYPNEGDLTEAEAERYDELAGLANAGELDEAGQAELDALQAILDGGYTAEQKRLAGAFIHVDHDGHLRITAGFVRPGETDAAIAAGVLPASRTARPESEAPKSPISAKLAEDLWRAAPGRTRHSTSPIC